jgi:arylsulfatase A-like enzyme
MPGKTFNRRDFLKVAGASLLPLAFSRQARDLDFLLQGDSRKPNILVVLLDTLSARNVSLYGYPRSTAPSLERFASRATVYHSHYSAGNFTTPGTASTLTGLNSWSHRAINISGLVKRDLVSSNIFRQIGNSYHRMAFTQNMLVEVLLRQFGGDLDALLPFTSASTETRTSAIGRGLEGDPLLSYYAYGDYLAVRQNDDGPLTGSPLLGLFNLIKQTSQPANLAGYPLGLPNNGYYSYTNADTFDFILREIERAGAREKPYFGYFHLWTPHEPYLPREEYVGKFKKDGYQPAEKPEHPLTDMHRPQKNLLRLRQSYDEYIADVDADLGKFLDALERNGVLDNTYVIVTSDHGQLFERGEHGHTTALMFDSVLHIPLLISAPGQTSRQDVYTPTSNIDLLPTLLAISGQQPHPGLEGSILPGLGGQDDRERSIYSLVASSNSAFAPLKKATIAMVKGTKKLIYYMGYGDFDKVAELYDLESDPEEMKDLASADSVTTARMRDELLTALDEANRPFQARKS